MLLSTRVRAEDLFSSLRHESEQEKERKIEVVNSPGLESIIEGYKKAIEYSYGKLVNFYEVCERSIPQKYTSKDITKFSIVFPAIFRSIDLSEVNINLRDSAPGYYFNVLINNCQENGPFRLECNNYDAPLRILGNKNSSKSVLVNGNVGECLGFEMSGGEIIVNGDADSNVGFLLYSGRIYLNGNYKSIATNQMGMSAEIYHKGRLIIKDRKKVPGANVKWG